jgi:hypothetical protein
MKVIRDGDSNVTLLARGEDEMKNIVIRFGEMLREHITGYRETIKELRERIEDLEGHAEHGPDGTCGVCLPEEDSPETVGAPAYGEIVTVDFEEPCAHPFCGTQILPGDEAVYMDEGKWVHDHCYTVST